MLKEKVIEDIKNGKLYLGIELGSTKIKLVAMTDEYEIAAAGSYTWASTLENGYWTYALSEVEAGLRAAFSDLQKNVKEEYGEVLSSVACMGISAMMHGYLAFDKDENLLVPFRTWQNTTTKEAAEQLSALFSFNIPQRWSIAHLQQAVLDGEEHVANIDFITTLAGYVHRKLTGKKVLGIGDASGMFPIDSENLCYNDEMIAKYDALIADKSFSWKLSDILPEIVLAGDNAGSLTEEGAAWLDPAGCLKAGIPVCAPEGDAGTGMTATNSVSELTGNVSAGTSVFSMIVLKDMMKSYYPEIDMVTTPDGKPVAMVHCNNCTEDMNAWVGMLGELFSEAGGAPEKCYEILYRKAEEGEPDCGGVVVCNYAVGEPITGISNGYPMAVREPGASFSLKNLSRAILYSAMTTLKLGNDILMRKEGVSFERITGHGGYFKNGTFGAHILASALKTPVTLMKNAEVGGPYGMALLASYAVNKEDGMSLGTFLAEKVFKNAETTVVEPSEETINGFEAYMKKNLKVLSAEKVLSEG